MIQSLSDFLDNFSWVNFTYFIATIIELYLVLTLLLLIFDISYSKKQKLLYLLTTLIISKLNSYLISSPFNVVLNYICMIILISLIFKINLLQSFASLITTVFLLGVFNILIQNPYITLLKISPETFIDSPKYRIPYLMLYYFFISCIIILLSKFKKNKLNLNTLNTLDKKTIIMLFLNLTVGFITLFMQLVISAYYIESLPIFISVFNFVLLLFFFVLSILNYSRIIKLALTRKDLEYAEDYNKSLQILYDKVSGFKHDFENIMFYLKGYINTNDLEGLKVYFNDIQNDYKIAANLSIINPKIINDPGLYSLITNKFFKATSLGISFDIEFFLDLKTLKVNPYIFSRILGILIDNAIEATEKCDSKIIKLSFTRENINNRAVITITNTYIDDNIDMSQIFKKGFSSKDKHYGIGLWEVNKYVRKSKNLELNPSKDSQYFKQELYIYDL